MRTYGGLNRSPQAGDEGFQLYIDVMNAFAGKPATIVQVARKRDMDIAIEVPSDELTSTRQGSKSAEQERSRSIEVSRPAFSSAQEHWILWPLLQSAMNAGLTFAIITSSTIC